MHREFLFLRAPSLGRIYNRRRNDKRRDKCDANTAHRPLHDLRFYFTALGKLPEPYRQNKFVHDRNKQVHDQNRKRSTLGIRAKPANQHRDDSKPDRIENTVITPFRGSRIIGRHKHGTEHQAARKQLQQNFRRALIANKNHNGSGQKIHDGNAPVDHAPRRQIYPARKDCDFTGFADASADISEQKLQDVTPVTAYAPKRIFESCNPSGQISSSRRHVAREHIGNIRADIFRH